MTNFEHGIYFSHFGDILSNITYTKTHLLEYPAFSCSESTFCQHYRSEHEQYSMSSMCFTHNLCICVSCPVSLLPQQRPVNSNVREKEDVLQKRCGIEGAFGTFSKMAL